MTSCFSQIGPFLFLDFFHSKSDEKLIKNTCYIYLHFSSRIYIWDLSGTLIASKSSIKVHSGAHIKHCDNKCFVYHSLRSPNQHDAK